MRITDLLKSESIALGQKPADKTSAIRQLADLMAASGNLSDKEQYLKDVFAREASGTTGLGDGIATPHAKSTGVKEAGLAAMTVPEGMDFESMDGNPARLFFMIAAPDSANDAHIQILQQLAMMIMDPDFKEALIAAKTKEEFLHLIDLKEDGKFEAPKAEAAEGDGAAAEEKPASDHIQVLAVTACPTGIAHTFMAAESLEQHAKKRGISIKVETNGSGGAKNILTDEEIAAADGIIVAADKNVAMARFNGKKVVITKVADGINKADELIDRALKGDVLPVLAGFISMSIADRPGLAVGFVGGALAGTTGSGFLGALIAGFLGGYIVNFLKKASKCLPDSLEGIKPMLIYPFFGILIMGFISLFIIAPPVSAINGWMVDTLKNMDPSARIFMGMIVAGMTAVDMGGPINKAAYVTGTGLLASGEFHVMAAVMAGGMVPPLAIALCTTFFKNRFTESERKAGVTNYVMGLSFITEGAIPFAAADPLRVIPACVVGSAVTGALTMAFDCTLRAPHGGIFVVPTIGNPLMYLVSILVGAIIGCLILSILKKPLKDGEDK